MSLTYTAPPLPLPRELMLEAIRVLDQARLEVRQHGRLSRATRTNFDEMLTCLTCVRRSMGGNAFGMAVLVETKAIAEPYRTSEIAVNNIVRMVLELVEHCIGEENTP
jgi:hypothetical protein